MSPSASLPGPSERSRWVVSTRGGRNRLDPSKPHSFLSEVEPLEDGSRAETWTLFLTNRECPWRCVMCDLWKNTLEHALEPGLIPSQIDYAFSQLRVRPGSPPRQLKLYNSGSFFDRRAVPAEDYREIADRARTFERLIVECHPVLVDERVLPFLELLQEGNATPTQRETRLEVALGLETVHPETLEKLNKGMTLQDFHAACRFLRKHGVSIRVFLLVHPPFLPSAETELWIRRSIQTALDAGASVVSLIPLRLGNGALDQLAAEGLASEPPLGALEAALDYGLQLRRGRIFADLWDLDRFSVCPECLPARRERLERMNQQQRVFDRVDCPRCGNQ